MKLLALSEDRAGDIVRHAVTTNNPQNAWQLVADHHARRGENPQRILVCIPGGKK